MNTKQELVNRLNEANNEETKGNRVHRHVSLFIKSQEEAGKTQVNGWWEKRAKKHFEGMGWDVRFYTIANQYYLIVSGGDTGFDRANEVRMFLGYGSDMGNLTQAIFEERNASYGRAAEARIAARTALTASDNDPWLNIVSEAIDAYKAAKATLDRFMGDCGPGNEAYYHIKALAGLE